MPKMFLPARRRHSGIIRYMLVATILIILYYYYGNAPGPYDGPALRTEPLPHGYSYDDESISPPKPPPALDDLEEDDGSLLEPMKPINDEYKSKTDSTESKQSASDADQPSQLNQGKTESKQESKQDTSESTKPDDFHPIDQLIYDAQHRFAEIVSKESKTVEEAAQAYRKRRGRHPPPGFNLWFEFAQNNSAVIVEDFFDQIYHDLEPFWGLEPAVLRKESDHWEMTINIRDGVASTGSDWFWTVIWLNLVKTIEHLLPDMDLSLNPMDEPRIVAPWEDINEAMKKAGKTVNLPKAKKVSSDFQKLPESRTGDPDTPIMEKTWEDTRPYWKIVQRGCAPDSPARKEPIQEDFSAPPQIDMSYAAPHMLKGFVSNYSMSTDLCHQPDLQGLEGILISPLSVSATSSFFPMFGGSKLGVNNEILLPAPMYWNEEERFTGGDNHGPPWARKDNKSIWRGVATGGKNSPTNWRRFQRHRFVAMNNGTKLAAAESGEHEPDNFALPEDQYHLQAQQDGKLAEWVDEWADIAFVDLMCDPPQEDGSCPYTDHYFERRQGMPMAQQFGSKYVPDIDGNSFSGRYLGFLRSTSLPIKAAVWKEWHDSRLLAWKHFVPMDSRFGDYYGIMDYFIGYNGQGGHDAEAEKIASEGKEWAEKVLRKEDMQIYTLRLLLEYARLLDERRETLGWVDDVLADPSLEKSWTWWW